MDPSYGFIVFKKQSFSYKVRIADVKRVFKINKRDCPKIPFY